MATSESTGARERASAANLGVDPDLARPFRTRGDTYCLDGDTSDKREPALLFNPRASRAVLIASLEGRVGIMNDWLRSLEAVEADSEMNHYSHYSNLAVLGEEIRLFVTEIARRTGESGEVQS